MSKAYNTKFLIMLFIATVFSLVAIPSISHAQINTTTTTDGETILTWKAQNFYPSNYQAKASATEGTPILISAASIINNQFVDLSGAEFTWNVDGNFYKQGIGMNEIILEADRSAGGDHFVRVTIVGDNLTFKGNITIPIHKTKTVIENPYPSKSLSGTNEKVFTSTPYFFNVSSFGNLSFFWEVNGVLQETRSRILQIGSGNQSISNGQNIITGIIANNQDRTESARSTINLNYSQ